MLSCSLNRLVSRGLSHNLLSGVTAVAAALMCAGALSAQQVTTNATGSAPVRLSANFVSQDHVRAHPELRTAYTLLEALHSNWMRERGVRPQPARAVAAGARSVAGENGAIQVYLDGHRMGGPEVLRGIPSGSVYSIRRINGVQAQARFWRRAFRRRNSCCDQSRVGPGLVAPRTCRIGRVRGLQIPLRD